MNQDSRNGTTSTGRTVGNEGSNPSLGASKDFTMKLDKFTNMFIEDVKYIYAYGNPKYKHEEYEKVFKENLI